MTGFPHKLAALAVFSTLTLRSMASEEAAPECVYYVYGADGKFTGGPFAAGAIPKKIGKGEYFGCFEKVFSTSGTYYHTRWFETGPRWNKIGDPRLMEKSISDSDCLHCYISDIPEGMNKVFLFSRKPNGSADPSGWFKCFLSTHTDAIFWGIPSGSYVVAGFAHDKFLGARLLELGAKSKKVKWSDLPSSDVDEHAANSIISLRTIPNGI
jgi:hypothetical protein